VKGSVAFVSDFDGTLTEADVVDSVLARFAKGREYLIHERRWAKGEISSAECMRKQLATVSVSKKELSDFLAGIKMDAGLTCLVALLRREHVPLYILSDGFDLFIQSLLEREGISDVPSRSNKLRHIGRRLIPSFPYFKVSCGRCGHCKRSSIAEIRKSHSVVIFVGDGLSDICAVREADAVFAKGSLAEYCKKHGIAHVPFTRLDEVARKLPHLLQEALHNPNEKENETQIARR